MNFRDLLNNNNYTSICIPRLQRDYAQGRESVKVRDIRRDLLSNIFSGSSLSLNMIFGDVDDKTLPGEKRFIPIDGQQRLTTLYLLHLYAHKNIEGFTVNNLYKFCYETRKSSEDFIKALLKYDWPHVEEGETLGNAIKNCPWFWWTWSNDPTVSGMLTVLSDIHNLYHTLNKFPNLDEITFDFQDLKENNLNETLYIKMNSRGLPLTEFEQIKCGLEELMNVMEPEFSKEWKWKMDRDWSEWFWDKKSHTLDNNFLWFIIEYTCCFYNCWSDSTNKLTLNKTQGLLNRLDNPQEEITWQSFRSIFEVRKEDNKTQLNHPLLNKYFNGLSFLLNRVTQLKGALITSWGDKYQFKIPNNNDRNRQRAMLFALSCYAGAEFNGKEFSEWFRFCANIIQHYDFSGEGIVSLCKALGKDYSCHSMDVLNWLSTTKERHNEQLNEERIKASLLLRRVDLVIEAEAHPLFKGRIHQLLIDDTGEYVNYFDNKKWKNIKRYFDEKGDIRNEYRLDFSVAFLKSLSQRNQLFDEDQKILNHTASETSARLKQKRYNMVYDRCLSCNELETLVTLPWKNEMELGQYRDQILQPGVIKSIIATDRPEISNMRFNPFGECWFFYPYNSRSTDWYIGLDRKMGNKEYDRLRNQFTKKLLEDGAFLNENTPQVVKGVNLWWERTYTFNWNGINFDWDNWYNLHLLDEKNNRIKNLFDKDKYYSFNALGLSFEELKQAIGTLFDTYQEDHKKFNKTINPPKK